MVKEAEGAGSDEHQVTPDQDNPDAVGQQITYMAAEKGLSSVRSLIPGGRTQPPRDKQPTAEEIDRRRRPGPESHMGD